MGAGGRAPAAGIAEHRNRGREHDERQQRELQAAAHTGGEEAGRQERAHHGNAAEHQGGSHLELPGPPVARRPDEARCPHDRKAHRDRRLRVEPEHIDEYRHGQCRAPAAQHAEREADQCRECQPESAHGFRERDIQLYDYSAIYYRLRSSVKACVALGALDDS